MPRKSDLMTIKNPKLDKRVKLTEKQREEIREIRNSEGTGYATIAKQFGVSKRLVQFICCPEKLEECKKRRAERGGSKVYYNKEYHAKAQRKHRQYKNQLFQKGLLK